MVQTGLNLSKCHMVNKNEKLRGEFMGFGGWIKNLILTFCGHKWCKNLPILSRDKKQQCLCFCGQTDTNTDRHTESMTNNNRSAGRESRVQINRDYCSSLLQFVKLLMIVQCVYFIHEHRVFSCNKLLAHVAIIPELHLVLPTLPQVKLTPQRNAMHFSSL